MHASKNIFSSTPYLLNWAKAGFGRHDLTWNREALLWFGVGTFWKNCIFMSEVGCEMESLGKFDKNFGETLERELEWSHFLRKRA